LENERVVKLLKQEYMAWL